MTLSEESGLVSVDFDLDGAPDWRQLCGLPNGGTLVILGTGQGQAIAQFYGDGGYATLVGKKIAKATGP